MANDPNNSGNNSTPNQAGDFGLSRLEEIAADNRPSAKERSDRAKAGVARAGLRQDEEFTSEQREYYRVKEIRLKNINTISKMEPRIRIAVEARQQRLTAQAVNAVSRDFSTSSINGQISDIAGSPEAQMNATSMMNTPYSSLVDQQRAGMARLQSLGEANRGMAYKVIGRQGMNQDAYGNIQSNVKEAQGIVNELGTISAALGQQRGQGLDPKSRMSDLFSRGAQAASIVNNADLSSDIAAGKGAYGAKSAGDIKEMEVAAARKLISALDDLKNASEDTKEHFQGLAEASEKNLKEIQAAKAAGAGGGGGNMAAGLGVATSGFNAIGTMAMQIGVNQRLAQAQNSAGLADIENTKYQTYKAAASGDIASLMQLGQFGGAEAFGQDIGGNAKGAVFANQLGGYAQLAGGALAVGETGGLAGAGDLIGGFATSSIADSDIQKKVSENQARIAATRAQLDVSRAIQAVGAEQVQGFFDYSKGIGSAAIGMGAAGEGFINRTVSDANLSSMAASRISPEQFAQMSQMGVASMGSMFNENQIFTARTNEQRGLGSMQENMQRMSALSAAGSNNPTASLGAITEGAVAKGLDSSKALNAVVDHTAAMAATTTGRAIGIDTSAAASALLTAGITKDTPNKEAALERSASLQETFNQVGTNAGTNYAGMVNIARIQKTTGLSGTSSVLASQISDADLMSMNAGNAAKMLFAAGIDTRGKNAPDMVAKLKEDRQMTLLETGTLVPGFDRADTLKRLKSGTALTTEEELGVNQAAAFLKMKTGTNVVGSDIKSRIQAFDLGAPQEAYGPANVNDGSARAKLDVQRTAGFAQLSAAAAEGASALGGAKTAVDALTAAFTNLLGAMPKTEAEATTAAGKAAGGGKGLDVSVARADKLIDKLGDTLNKVFKDNNLGSIEAAKPMPVRQGLGSGRQVQ